MTVGQTTNVQEPMPLAPWGEQPRSDGRPDGEIDEVVEFYRAALQSLVGRRSYESFELLLLWSVSEAVVALRRRGIGGECWCTALAARHALTQMERRCDAAGPFEVLLDERAALDDLLRAHGLQLRNERLAAVLLAQTIDNTHERLLESRPHRTKPSRACGAGVRTRPKAAHD